MPPRRVEEGGGTNLTPLSSVSTPSGPQSGVVSISYTLSDTEANPMSVKVEFSLGGTTFTPASEKVGQGDGTTGLQPGPHTFAWDSKTDIGPVAISTISVKITPSDSSEGTSSTTATFKVDNNSAPSVKITAPTGTITGPVNIVYTLSDPESDPTSVVVLYSTDAVNYVQATEKSGIPSEGTAALTTSVTGMDHTFVWNSALDIPNAKQNTVYIKIKPIDTKAGTEVTTFPSAFTVDNLATSSPIATITTPFVKIAGTPNKTYNLSGRIRFPYNLASGISGSISIVAEYSTDSGETWITATKGAGGEGLSNLTSDLVALGGVDHVFEWDSFGDLGEGDFEVVFRITPSDTNGAGQTVTSEVFRVDHSGEMRKYNSTLSDMITPRRGLAVVTANNPKGFPRIYAIGGEIGTGTFTGKVEEYNPYTDTWTDKFNGTATAFSGMPTPRGYFACGVYDNKIFIVGGRDGNGALAKVESFDPATNTWDSTNTDMPTARFECAGAVVGNFLYVFGGATGTIGVPVLSNKTEKYDLSGDAWGTVTSLGAPRKAIGVATWGTDIVLVGGEDGAGMVNTVEKYFPASNSFSALAPALPTAKKGVAVAIIGGYPHAFGGIDGTGQTNGANIRASGWESIPTPTARAFFGVARVGNFAYLIGGEEAGSLSSVQTTSYELGQTTFRTVTSMHYARNLCSAGTIGDNIYVVGGDGFSGLSKVEAYDPWTDSFAIQTGDYPYSLATRAGAVAKAPIGGGNANIREFLYIFGGTKVASPTTGKEIYRYDPVLDTWSHPANLTYLRAFEDFGASAVTINGSIFLFGGLYGFWEKYTTDPPSVITQSNGSQHESATGNGVYIYHIYQHSNGFVYLWINKDSTWLNNHIITIDPNGTANDTEPPRDGSVLATMYNKVWIMGGETDDFNPNITTTSNAVFLFNLDASKSNGSFATFKQRLPYKVSRADSANWNQKVYIFGGVGSINSAGTPPKKATVIEMRP